MIYLVSFIAGDTKGFMGRDKSTNTLRLELYFERETGIVKRFGRIYNGMYEIIIFI
jgi:hypothetical protein